jgi:hypothetical protein
VNYRLHAESRFGETLEVKGIQCCSRSPQHNQEMQGSGVLKGHGKKAKYIYMPGIVTMRS